MDIGRGRVGRKIGEEQMDTVELELKDGDQEVEGSGGVALADLFVTIRRVLPVCLVLLPYGCCR